MSRAQRRQMPTFDDTIRHNWGFRDALNDIEAGRPRRDVSGHFDLAYADGYRKACWQIDRCAEQTPPR